MSEKTEEPTDKKLDDARKKGQVPQRKNVLEAVLLLTGVTLVMSLWPTFAAEIALVADFAILSITEGYRNVSDPLAMTIQRVLLLIVSIAAALGTMVLLLNLLLNRFNFAPAALTPKFQKFNPVSGLKGIFSKQTVYNFGRLLIYFSAVAGLLYYSIRSNLVDITYAAACGLTCLAEVFSGMILQMVVLILMLLLLLAAADFKLQTVMFRSQNKMSKDEVKREHKSSEGDPHVRGMRRQIAHEDLVMPSPKDVTHVIYGANHLVAVLYNPGQTPFVVMKGRGSMVALMQQRFRMQGAKCVNIASVAQEFHKKYRVGNYMDAKAAKGMALVLRATGELG
jgi:type III secretory pathway component EscU